MAAPHCPAQGKCFLLGRAVAVGITDSRGFLAFLQELQKALGAFVVFTLLKEHGVLLDFTVEILRDDIAGTRNELTVLEALRKRNEAGLSIAGLHKLIGLADVVAQNGLAFNRFFQAEGLQRLVGSFAVRRKLRIRNGHMLDIGRIEHGGNVVLHQVGIGRPEHKFAHCIGKGGAGLQQQLWPGSWHQPQAGCQTERHS